MIEMRATLAILAVVGALQIILLRLFHKFRHRDPPEMG